MAYPEPNSLDDVYGVGAEEAETFAEVLCEVSERATKAGVSYRTIIGVIRAMAEAAEADAKDQRPEPPDLPLPDDNTPSVDDVTPEKSSQPGHQGVAPLHWALAVLLEKVEVTVEHTRTMRTLVLGDRFAADEDAAVGSFLRACLNENPGYRAGQVLTLRIEASETPIKRLSKPSSIGFWWWLPEDAVEENKGHLPAHWAITTAGPSTSRVGQFVGPLSPPVWTKIMKE